MNVEFITPKSAFFNIERFTLLHRAHMRVMAIKIERELRSTVKAWTHKPSFSVKYARDEISITTDDDLYALVDAGSPAHTIVSVRARRLVFQNKYKAKTSPGVIGSSSGGKSGIIVTATRIPRHPGFQARKFIEAIKKRNDLEFFDGENKAVAEANT